jgi:RimJ/RimL family protein N-acetyltransferase
MTSPKIPPELHTLSNLVLHPYTPDLVLKYNSWMQDPELLENTGSEPLTLHEEYENQISWWEDPHKYTFILIDKHTYDAQNPANSMIGDINLFIHPDGEGEINVMIAEKAYRGKGLAKEAVMFMIEFGRSRLNLNRILAKILRDNTASIGLFEKLGFRKFEEIEDFNEVHYEYNI